MNKPQLWMLAVAFGLCGMIHAQTTIVNLLDTKDNGSWPCVYYLLNSNDELVGLDPKEWAGQCVDESDWIFGYGPLSNSYDQFRTTIWASEVQPLLIRRHFSLTAADMADLPRSIVALTCSFDENPHFYLNGKSLWSLSGWNDNDYATRTLTSRQKALLHEGDNILAVSLMQGGGGGHIDFGLTMTRPDNQDAVKTLNYNEDTDRFGYNLGGIQLTHPVATGLYIKNNRKIAFLHK